MKIICDKCKSDRVDKFTKINPVEKVLTMEEYLNNSKGPYVVNAVMVYTPMVLLCKDCGYRREYTTS